MDVITEKFKNIKLLILDVDGVLTDGTINKTDSGEEFKRFHVRDGSGMKYWKRTGGLIALISGKKSDCVKHRAAELDVDVVKLGRTIKEPAIQEVFEELGITGSNAAIIGDDLMDIPMVRNCAVSFAVADAVDELKERVDIVLKTPGGRGAVREAIEMILKSNGKWDQVMERYL